MGRASPSHPRAASRPQGARPAPPGTHTATQPHSHKRTGARVTISGDAGGARQWIWWRTTAQHGAQRGAQPCGELPHLLHDAVGADDDPWPQLAALGD
eukprot:7320777-Prymnesium_polylepis.2